MTDKSTHTSDFFVEPANIRLNITAGSKTPTFIEMYREKPLTKFQIFMYKLCFGIEAENI